MINEIRKRVERNDRRKDKADEEIEKAFKSFDPDKARKKKGYLKAFVEKKLAKIIINNAKRAYTSELKTPN